MPGEISPENWFVERSRRERTGREKRALGSSPEKRLPLRKSPRRFFMVAMSGEREPERALKRRLKVLSSVRLAKVPAGISPMRPTPGSRRAVTRPLRPLEQETPRQEHGEAVAFQLRTKGPTAARKAKSAAASPARSGAPPGRKARRMKMRRKEGEAIEGGNDTGG